MGTAVYQNQRPRHSPVIHLRLLRHMHRNAADDPVVALLGVDDAFKRDNGRFIGT